MTPFEYLEHVQEALAFSPTGVGKDPAYLLYATEEQCRQLQVAHEEYVQRVGRILGIIPMASEPPILGYKS